MPLKAETLAMVSLRIWIKTRVLTNLAQDPCKIQADPIEANLRNLCWGIQRQNISMVPRRMCDVFLNDNLHRDCLLQGFHRSFKKLC